MAGAANPAIGAVSFVRRDFGSRLARAGCFAVATGACHSWMNGLLLDRARLRRSHATVIRKPADLPPARYRHSEIRNHPAHEVIAPGRLGPVDRRPSAGGNEEAPSLPGI